MPNISVNSALVFLSSSDSTNFSSDFLILDITTLEFSILIKVRLSTDEYSFNSSPLPEGNLSVFHICYIRVVRKILVLEI